MVLAVAVAGDILFCILRQCYVTNLLPDRHPRATNPIAWNHRSHSLTVCLDTPKRLAVAEADFPTARNPSLCDKRGTLTGVFVARKRLADIVSEYF